MDAGKVTRKLAAILAADVAGYSRLMGADEAGTLAALKGHRDELIGPEIAKRGGRIVGTAGDSVLAEFASVVDAVDCAVAIQAAMAERNAGLPDDRKMLFRIGINLGDVIVEGDDIYGDGVNIAARLEELAEPGGICVSAKVHGEVAGKVEAGFDDMGKRSIKNIAEPVRVWRVTLDQPAAASQPLPLPDKPSIAVLPFVNMSGDAEQEYFSDGITEDIITELSRFRSLFVIARNSSFAYKGKSVKVQEIGRSLGVAYVVEGSVRKAGNRVRVTAQLVEAESGNHVWAERYDRDLEDIFAVQDEITGTIASTVGVRLKNAGAKRAQRKKPSSMTAHDYLLQGIQHTNISRPEDNSKARELYRKAIEIDPEYAPALAGLAGTYVDEAISDWVPGEGSPSVGVDEALEHIHKAIVLDDSDGFSHAVLGLVLFLQGKDLDAEARLKKATILNPNDADIAADMALILTYFGRPKEAIGWINRAIRFNPLYPDWYNEVLGIASYIDGDYEQAIDAFSNVTVPDTWNHAYLAASYGQLGRIDEAHAELAEFIDLRRSDLVAAGEDAPTALTDLAQYELNMHRRPEDRDRFLDGLRKAGLDV